MATLDLNRPIVFFDLETTGLNPATDRIVELALVKLLPGGKRESFVRRVNPGRPIPAETTAIHGITDEDVKDAPEFKHIAKDVYNWVRGSDFGGYNVVRFDLPVLVEELLRAGLSVDFSGAKLIDVQKIFFRMEQRTLSAAYKFYCGKPLENAHNAEADTNATIEILEAQLDHYEELKHDVAGLSEFLADEDELVDYARAMVRKGGKVVFNIGKYKGQAVEDVFKREPGYYDWMMKADFSLHTKQKISEILNNMKLAKLKGN